MIRVINLIICIAFCSCSTNKNINIYGNTNYSQDSDKKMNSKIGADHRISIYIDEDKKWETYIGNKLVIDYDHFGKEVKTNVITSIGIDF